MKTYKTFNRTFATAAIVVTTSSMAFVSCQNDQLDNNATSKETIEDVATTEVNDSIFTNNYAFDYANTGTKSASQYVSDVDFGPTSATGIHSRGVGLAVTSVALNVMNFVGMNFLNNAVAKGNNKVIDAILGTGSTEMAKLDEMSMDIKNIASMVSDLKQQAEDESVAKLYNERMQNYSGLDLNNSSYFDAYLKAVKNKNFDQANSIANRWSQEMINGAYAPTATYNYLNMISQTANGSQKSMTDIYDYWVYQTTPWEHMGYQKREQLRASDVCIALTGYMMSRAFYEQDTTEVGQAKIAKLNEALVNFINYYKNHINVEHHDDKLVCQIKGAHIVMNKNIVTRNMEAHPWISNGTRWNDKSLKTMMYSELDHDADYVLAHSLTASEAKAIYNYYNSNSTTKISMYQIMKDKVGFNMNGLADGKTHIMTLNSGASMKNESFFNNNYFFKFNEAVDASSTTNPMLSNLSIGKMWLESFHYTKSFRTYKVLRWWNNYDASNKDFFRVDIDHRYTDMKAF